MKITLEVENLKTFIDGFNNSLVAYGQQIAAARLQLEHPAWMDKHFNKDTFDYPELAKRYQAIRNIYDQLLELEKNNN